MFGSISMKGCTLIVLVLLLFKKTLVVNEVAGRFNQPIGAWQVSLHSKSIQGVEKDWNFLTTVYVDRLRSIWD